MSVASTSCQSTLYFDGSCSLCQAEIGYYRKLDRSGALRFVDVSAVGASAPDEVTRQQAMERFHVQAGDGRTLSGAAELADGAFLSRDAAGA